MKLVGSCGEGIKLRVTKSDVHGAYSVVQWHWVHKEGIPVLRSKSATGLGVVRLPRRMLWLIYLWQSAIHALARLGWNFFATLTFFNRRRKFFFLLLNFYFA